MVRVGVSGVWVGCRPHCLITYSLTHWVPCWGRRKEVPAGSFLMTPRLLGGPTRGSALASQYH